MKLVYHDFDILIDTSYGISELIIESQIAMMNILTHLNAQLNGQDGPIVVSENNNSVPINKNVELITSLVPFEINKKNLVNKLVTRLVESSVDETYYEKTLELSQRMEAYLYELASTVKGSIIFSKCNTESIIKNSGVLFEEEYETIGEKLLDYFELVREYDKDKLYIIYNLRSVITDSELEQFIRSVKIYNYNIILLESSEHIKLKGLQRIIMDKDYCWIS